MWFITIKKLVVAYVCANLYTCKTCKTCYDIKLQVIYVLLNMKTCQKYFPEDTS